MLNKIIETVEDFTGSLREIEAIGHHELKRHEVFRLFTRSSTYVLKCYYKPNRWNREIAVLKRLKGIIPTPEIIAYDEINGIQWLLMNDVPGHNLKDLQTPESVLKEYYCEMGQLLAKIHSVSYDFFGSMTENNVSLDGFTDFRSYLENQYGKIKRELDEVDHDDPALITQASGWLEGHFHLTDGIHTAWLCHNDFGPRNILVHNHALTVIDFEQSLPGDPHKEWIEVYYELERNAPVLAGAFKEGYTSLRALDEEAIKRKRKFYEIYAGLTICAWAKSMAYDYYLYGMSLLERNVEE